MKSKNGEEVGQHSGVRRLLLLGPEQADQQKSATDDNRAVGEVEGGPVQLADVEIEEVSDGAADDAVEDVAESAAQDEGQADSRGPVEARGVPQDARHQQQGGEREANEEERPPCGGGVGEHAEGRAAVAR